jgi:hypothetical protein
MEDIMNEKAASAAARAGPLSYNKHETTIKEMPEE